MEINNTGRIPHMAYTHQSVSDKVEGFKFKMQVLLGTLKDQINDGNYVTAKLYTQMFLESINLDKTNNGVVIDFYRVMDFIDRSIVDDSLEGIDKSKLVGIINTLMSSFEAQR